MTILCALKNSSQVSRKIFDWSMDNNLSAKTEWLKGVIQGISKQNS